MDDVGLTEENVVIKWWGPREPILHHADTKIPTPLGERCQHCLLPIAEGEQGWSLPRLGDHRMIRVPYHDVCLRENIGLV
jgi:hypothetical protein